MEEFPIMEVLHGYRQVKSDAERCFNIEVSEPLTTDELGRLRWVLAETFEQKKFAWEPFLGDGERQLVELGPNMNFATSGSTNALSICHAFGLTKVTRAEISRRTLLPAGIGQSQFIAASHDRMTECQYPEPLISFATGKKREPVRIIPVLEQGEAAIRQINEERGLAMDIWDVGYYNGMFRDDLRRDPIDVELFQLGTANSEHSRHGYFKGRQKIDGQYMPKTLLEIIQSSLKRNPGSNSVIAFSDNSSAIRGYDIWTIVPQFPGECSKFVKRRVTYHILFTAETHNFPSGIAPIPGAETGTGGRIRDVQATGRGGLKIAGTAGFCVGALHIPGYKIPGEGDPSWPHPPNLALPLDIFNGIVEGAWKYGNQIGEPVILGFCRSCDFRLPSGERRAWLKPIMFTGGVGQVADCHLKKDEPQKGMLIIQVGGPAYRIGLGGGSASSKMQGDNDAQLDFTAVQRGDAQMGKKGDNVVRACVEMGDKNPICIAHDQGAGGPCNVLTELIHPAGGVIYLRRINLGDHTMSDLEIWGAEYQERNGYLIWEDRLQWFLDVCKRERVKCEVLGKITGDGRVVVYGTENETSPIVDLPLEKILGKIPQKTFEDKTVKKVLRPLELPKLSCFQAIKAVFAQLSVGSKEGILHRVDRNVTGLIARAQPCGPVQIPVSDFAVVAQSHFGFTGAAITIGEQSMKMLVNEEAGARMGFAEAITNAAGALVSGRRDIKSSVNWMWAPKLPGEGAAIYRAAVALSNFSIDFGGGEADGGKDSLGMAAKVGAEMVKAPGEMVVSGYVTVPDIRRVLTPDIKHPGKSHLLHLDLGKGKMRLGGSALAQAHGQIGDESPDIDARTLRAGFEAVQELLHRKLITAIHDISDGGFITTVLEMIFAGNCGVELLLSDPCYNKYGWERTLFHEEAGWVLEYNPKNLHKIRAVLQKFKLLRLSHVIGRTLPDDRITINLPTLEFNALRSELLELWRETSFQISALVANPKCVEEERRTVHQRDGFIYTAPFDFDWTKADRDFLRRKNKPRVAILREEGTNGDREMASAFFLAGFEVVDVAMTDLIEGRITLRDFVGIAFPGGFSFADVFDSAKGWAAVIKFNRRVADEFAAFLAREDTFTFGICNGCQLMALLGIVPWQGIKTQDQPRFIRNVSGVFESRWVNLAIDKSDSIFLQGMEGASLGCVTAHGEGQAFFPNRRILSDVLKAGLAPIRYVDDKGQDTEQYPLNPNGSPMGIAGLVSPCGRHFAMMPHPERLFRPWQWPYWPPHFGNPKVSPWFQMFRNARNWCYGN